MRVVTGIFEKLGLYNLRFLRYSIPVAPPAQSSHGTGKLKVEIQKGEFSHCTNSSLLNVFLG